MIAYSKRYSASRYDNMHENIMILSGFSGYYRDGVEATEYDKSIEAK